jgi:tape measure domain
VEVAALGLRVDGVDNIDRASSSLGRLADSAKNAETASGQLDRASKSSSKSLSEVTRESDRASRSMGALASAIKPVAASLAAAFSVRTLTQYADSWSDMTSLVRVNISAQDDAAAVMERLADIARTTYSSLELTARGFAQNAFTLTALGKSTRQQLDYTSALNNALVISGAKGQQAQIVQDSLNRAMAEGSLRGQELQNVLNYGSAIASLLAEELGVNVAQLREMAKEGRITSEVIFNALVKNMERLEQTAESMPATIGDAFLLLRNSVLQAVGVYDQANGISVKFAESLVKIADVIRDTDWGPYIRALTTGAKIAAAYVVAVRAIPVAKAAAAAATTAYQSVLAAFSSQVAVTTAALWRMNTALGVVGAAFAGWQIGTYLRNEFEIVEKAGIALMGGLHTVAIQIGGFFREMGERIKFAVTNPIDAIRGSIADFLEWMSGLGRDTLKFLGFEGLADSIKTEFASIRGATAAEHKAMLEQIRAETAAEVELVNNIYAEMFANVGKEAKEASSGISDLAGEVGNLTNETVKLAAAQEAAAAAEERRLEGILNELTALERAVATWGMTSKEVKLYDLAMQGATAAQLEYAQGLLDTIAGLEKAKEEEEAYLRLVKDLRTEEERLTDEFRERIAVLDAMAASTRIASDEYAAMASRVAEAAFTAAPEFAGLAPEVGGAAGELLKINEAQEKLQLWYDTQLEMLNQFRAERSDLNAQWDAQEEALKQEHEAKLAEIEKARQMASLNLAGDFFGQLSALQKSESSKARAIGKAAAIAEATINTYRAATAAYAAMAGIPVVGPALGVAAASAAIAAGMANVAAIQGQAHDGIMSVPEDGTWYLKKGERVTTAETSAKLDRTLDAIMGRMQALPTNVVPFPSRPSSNVGNSTNVVVNVHNAPPGTQVEQSTGQDGADVIDIWIADFTSGGRTASAVQSKFGLQPQGR